MGLSVESGLSPIYSSVSATSGRSGAIEVMALSVMSEHLQRFGRDALNRINAVERHIQVRERRERERLRNILEAVAGNIEVFKRAKFAAVK